ncbi:uncharacterized protein LOC101887445 [Musca domestica]|uniref:Uncharacterized protein LOC101887445 n=1 Tax=Musca domestica TaxID=7370 RepID=A0A1I8NHQ4_MUSDO|nr:uncharacterized protein LOC101887445 [Musca domestica]
MPNFTQLILLSFAIFLTSLGATHGNVVFRFGFNFGIDSGETLLKSDLQIGDGSIKFFKSTSQTETSTTEAPHFMNDIWSQQSKLNVTANDKFQKSRDAVTHLRNDLSDVVGRSDYLAAQVKLMTRYLNKANIALETSAANRFRILQDFVQLVDELKTPPGDDVGGERSLDYAVMKMALDKHRLVELQNEIVVDVLQAMQAWQDFVKNKMIEVSTV